MSNILHLIGYSRISTGNQRDGFGIRIQEDRIKTFAKERDMPLMNIFRDEAVSGSLQNRPALIKLLDFADTHKHLPLGLVFLRLDRLARDLLVQEGLIADFQKRGLQVFSIEEPDLCGNEPTRKLFRQMKGMLAEYEKAMITVRMSAGRIKKVESGKGYAGGRPPYGFRTINGEYQPVENEIAVVRQVHKLRRKPKFGKRMSYQGIADRLNGLCIPAPLGQCWYARTVQYLYLNPAYKGIQRYSSVQIPNLNLRIL